MYNPFLIIVEFSPSIWAAEGADFDPEAINAKVFPSPLSTAYTVKPNQNEQPKEEVKKGCGILVFEFLASLILC